MDGVLYVQTRFIKEYGLIPNLSPDFCDTSAVLYQLR